MKSKFSLLILLFAARMAPEVSAQVPLIDWQKCLGGSSSENANSIEQTADSGYIVAGYTFSNNGDVSGNHGNYDYWVVKLNKNGSLVWQKCLGGSDIDEGYSVSQTFDGGFFVSGLSLSANGDVSGNHGNYDFWVAKLDAAGSLLWQNSLGGSADDVSYSNCQTKDSGYIVAGYTHSSDGDVSGIHGSDDCWIVKLNNNGILQWQKCLGGTDSEYARDIKETKDNGFIFAASSFSNDGDVSLNHGNDDYWIVKLDSLGNILWQKVFGGSSHDNPKSIQQTEDGGYIVAGTSSSADGDVTVNLGSSDYWILKLDSSGNLIWQKSLGGSAADYANAIQQTSKGFIVAGRSYSDDGDVTVHYGFSDYWMVQMDSTGSIEWEKSLGGSNLDEALSLVVTIDSGFIIAGNSTSNDDDVSGNHGNGDMWIVKLLNPACQVYYYDGDGDGYGNSLVADTFCNGIPAGYVTNDLDCDDANAAVNPSAIETCNGIDDNCDGNIDEGVQLTFYFDFDGDGYGDAYIETFACSAPSGYVADNTDCDDGNIDVNPGANEICNTVDDNCNGQIDEGVQLTCYADADGDGYGNANIDSVACNVPVGYVLDSTDCNDANPNIYPGAIEITNNGIDDDCDGFIDEFPTNIQNTNVLQLWSVFPNPASGTSFINYTLSSASTISIDLYNVIGNKLQQLLNDDLPAGEHNSAFDTRKLANGVYVLQIRAGNLTASKKIVVIN
ncbi:MAG TPA: MopE-related protein [Chitinophagales bacterium]|nr:MopE-related protein [Chitinophagales bacterium]